MPVKEDIQLVHYLFKDYNPNSYFLESSINEFLEINEDDANNKLERKHKYDLYETVDPNNTTPLPVELDDLNRLHYLVTSRKCLTLIEFGTGKSSTFLAHALLSNQEKYGEYVKENIRRKHAFELHSIDDNKDWLNNTKKNTPDNLKGIIHFHFCPTEISSFNDRLCTYFHNLPNIAPDLIYLDGPSQFSPIGSLRGLSTADMDRMPMAADILCFEHFLAPGTLIVVDGRTANARFLKTNLQRDWIYNYSEEMDQHFFELQEQPLGIYNRKHLEFALDPDWIKQ